MHTWTSLGQIAGTNPGCSDWKLADTIETIFCMALKFKLPEHGHLFLLVRSLQPLDTCLNHAACQVPQAEGLGAQPRCSGNPDVGKYTPELRSELTDPSQNRGGLTGISGLLLEISKAADYGQQGKQLRGC